MVSSYLTAEPRKLTRKGRTPGKTRILTSKPEEIPIRSEKSKKKFKIKRIAVIPKKKMDSKSSSTSENDLLMKYTESGELSEDFSFLEETNKTTIKTKNKINKIKIN